MESTFAITDVLCRNGLAAIPLAVLVAILCRMFRSRPATKHTLWLVVLLWFVVAPLLPATDVAERLGSDLAARVAEPWRAAPLEPESTRTAEPAPGTHEPPQTEPPAVAEIPYDPNDYRTLAAALDVPSHSSEPQVIAPEDCRPAVKASPRSAAVSSIASTHAPASSSLIAENAPDASMTTIVSVTPAADPPAVQPTIASPVTNRDAGAEPAATRDLCREWVAGLAAVRDDIARLPAIPGSVWMIGLLGLAACCLLAVLHTRWRLRHAVPAPATVTRAVAGVAAAYGLKHAPQTFMVDDCVSPMVTCGRRPRLILPIGLWAQLDGAGRRAIICHELAHLRRRDHWVRWGQLIVLALYWWHPLAWWVRRKLSEEAELCCDAWVTWLMPQGRRAYAQALLKTKQFVSQHRAGPVVGIGVTSPHAKRFARRIKMVMSERVRPGLSLRGMALSVALVAAGWLAAPLWACPPEESSAKATKHKHKHAHTTPAPEAAPDCEDVEADAEAATDTFIQHLTGRFVNRAAPGLVADGPRRAGGGSTPAPGARGLEERMERLERQLENVTKRLEELSSSRFGAFQAVPPVAPVPPVGVGATTRALIADQGNRVVRTYKVSKGKLDALYNLMKRDDVPILVRKLDDGIEVHGTETQQAHFRAFIQMIDPRDDRGSSAAEWEHHQAMALLGSGEVDAARRLAELEKAAALAGKGGLAAVTSVRAAALAEQAAHLAEHADHLRAHADELRAKADELRAHADELREEAGEADDQPRAHELETEAEAVERQAEELEEQAEHVEEQAEEVSEQAESIRSQIEEMKPGLAR